MKKLLIASTALSLAGGAAFAEMAITVSGDAEMGVDYASEPAGGASKHSFVHEVGIDFEGSGTTDGGLTFGGSAGFDTKDTDLNTGTVHVSGSFGKLTIGDNDAADLTAGGIDDIGMNGIGVDDMVEGLRGTTAGQLRYDNSFGQVSIAISAGTSAAVAAVAKIQPTAWTIKGHDGTMHVYPVDYSYTMVDGVKTTALTAEPMLGQAVGIGSIADYAPTNFDKVFGVTGRSTVTGSSDTVNVSVDHDDDADTADVVVNIFGFKEEKDGTITAPDDTIDTDNGDERDTIADNEANARYIKAFAKYVAGHELGKDEMVGGENPAAGDTGDKNADTIKEGVVDDNAVAAVPAVASDSEYAFGMSFNAGGVTIGVGYDSNKTVSMGAGFTTGEITTNLLYVKTEDDNATPADEEMTGMGVDMAYSMGASTVTLAYGRRKPEMGEAMDAVGMGVTHDLGGGATMNAGFGKVDKKVGTKIVSENKASVGLMFAF